MYIEEWLPIFLSHGGNLTIARNPFPMDDHPIITIALLGDPKCGKTSFFS